MDGLHVGLAYNVRTFDLAPGTDTIVVLYDKNGNPVTTNDDIDSMLCFMNPAFCASSLNWTPTETGPYFLWVRTLTYPDSQYPICFCPGYSITATPLLEYLPMLLGEVAEPTNTPTVTPTPTATMSSTPTVTPTASPTGPPVLVHPKAVAVDSARQRLYVTSRDNDRLFVLSAQTLQILNSVVVGHDPWGVAYNPTTDKIYVANFSGSVTVLNASTLGSIHSIPVGGFPTYVKINPTTGRVMVVSYGSNKLTVINGVTDTIEAQKYTGGAGAWGLAVNPTLNRVYISHRDSGTITTLDGNDGFNPIDGQLIKVVAGSSYCIPYSVEFSPGANKLYAVCAPSANVNTAIVYGVTSSGLTRIASGPIGNGGSDGGGGIAVNPASKSAFITNSLSNSVTAIRNSNNAPFATVPVGQNPFGIAVDPVTSKVYTANRDSNNVSQFMDPSVP
jgi:YVTN family beta-propeller protein